MKHNTNKTKDKYITNPNSNIWFCIFINLGYKSKVDNTNIEPKLLKNTLQSNSNQLQELNDVKDDVEMIEIPKSNLSDNQIDENIFLDNNKISIKKLH